MNLTSEQINLLGQELKDIADKLKTDQEILSFGQMLKMVKEQNQLNRLFQVLPVIEAN